MRLKIFYIDGNEEILPDRAPSFYFEEENGGESTLDVIDKDGASFGSVAVSIVKRIEWDSE